MNSRHIKKNMNEVPLEFRDFFTLEQHQKAQNYTLEKSKVGLIQLLIHFIMLALLIPFGFANWIDLDLRGYYFSQEVTGLCFFAYLGVLSFILDLPFKIYSTFVIEEKYGFNKTTPKLFIIDMIKETILGIIIGAPLLYVILKLMNLNFKEWWLVAYFIFFGFQFLMLYLYPVLIAPLFNKFNPLPDSEIKTAIEDLLKRVDFKFSGLYVMDASKRSSHGNAYFTGFGKNKRIVFFDTLLNQLSKDEIVAVLAHELGHFKKKHIMKMLIFSMVFGLVGFFLLGQLYQSEHFYSGHNFKHQSSYVALYLFSTVLSLYLYPLTPVFSFFSRKNEFEADHFASEHANAQDLINALLKMYRDNASTLTPSKWYSRFYYSHPPASERVKMLKTWLK